MTRRITCKKQAKGLAAIAEPRPSLCAFLPKLPVRPLYTTFLIGTIIETGNGGCLSCSQIVSEPLRFHSGAWWVKNLIQPTIRLLSNDAGVQQSRGGGRYTAPVKLCRSNAHQSFLKVWLRRPKRVRRLSRTWWRNSQREKYAAQRTQL